eukprot:jgi/Undpi1/7688/HiC_scaffold_23.g10161.m1
MSPVLHYFGIPARGEATRVALAMAGVDFVDKRMAFEDLPACRFKTVPVYEMDGTDYTQSTALVRYAGKLGGTYPDDALEALKVDEIVMILEDVFINLFVTLDEKDEAKKVEKCKALMAGTVKDLLGDVVRKAAANTRSVFCVGNSITIADITLHAVVATVQAGLLTGIPTTMVEDIAPSLMAIDDAVMEHPKSEGGKGGDGACSAPEEDAAEGKGERFDHLAIQKGSSFHEDAGHGGSPGPLLATRVALAVAGVDFVDKRMAFEDLPACRFKTVPVYEMDGTDYTQSTALLRYAGKLGGTYPEDPIEALKVDEIVMILEDVFINLFDVARKAAANTRSAFCVGGSLTIADITLHAVVATVQAGFLTGIPTTMVEDIAPCLKAIDDAVMEHPKVKAYYASKASVSTNSRRTG